MSLTRRCVYWHAYVPCFALRAVTHLWVAIGSAPGASDNLCCAQQAAGGVANVALVPPIVFAAAHYV